MQQKVKVIGTVSKEKIKMKGLHTPQFFIWIMGMIHNHRGLIVESSEGYQSPYMNKKSKDFHEYVAKMYQCTSVLLSQHILGREQALSELQIIEEELGDYPDIRQNDSNMSVAEHRYYNNLKKEKEKLEAKRKECLQRLKKEEKSIETSEAETEEMILGIRCKMEGLLFTYLSGAHKAAEKTAFSISSPHDAIQIYRKYVSKSRDLFCKTEDDNVVQHPDV